MGQRTQVDGRVLTDAEVEAVTARLLEPGPLAVRLRAFAERHAVLLRRVRRAWAIWSWISIVLFVVALILVPSLRVGIRPALWSYAILIQLFLLARTKTLSWRFATGAFVAACVAAPLIGLADVVVARLIGADINLQDGAVLVAGPVEEVGKLVPLLLLLWFARRRAARLSACDFLLLGGIFGLGFQAVEDTIRRLAATARGPSLFDLLDRALGISSQGLPQYGFGLLPGWSQYEGAWFAGHYVGTAIVAAGIGLALRARRAPQPLPGPRGRHRSARPYAPRAGGRWAAALALLGMVIADHAMYNANASLLDDPRLPHTVGIPGWLEALHALWGSGWLQRPLLLVLLALCVVADVRRARRVDELLPPLPRVRLATWLDRLGGRLSGAFAERVPLPPPLAKGTVAAGRWLLWSAADVVNELALGALVLGSGRRDERAGDEQALPLLQRLALALANLRRRRELGQGLGRYVERLAGARRHASPVAAAAMLSLPVLLLAFLTIVAAADDGGQAAFLANLFDDLAEWWEGLGPVGQIAVVVGIAGLLTLTGGLGLLPALGIATTVTSAASYGHGIATFIRDPRQATRDFIANLTPGQVLGYGLELALTRLLPGGFGGVVGREARSLYRLNRRYPGFARNRLREALGDLRYDDTGAIRLGRGRPGLDEVFGTARRSDPDFQVPAPDGRRVPASRVRLSGLDQETIDQVVGADPGGLDPVQRRMQLDYQRHLTGTDGRTPLQGDELTERLRALRAEGQGWTATGGAPVNGKFAGQRVFFSHADDAARFPDGVYYDLHGYPDFTPYARHQIDLPTTGDRNLDIRLANRAFQRRNNPMWQGLPAGETPQGWTWHHVQGGRKMQLVPTAVHEAARHTGGIGARQPPANP